MLPIIVGLGHFPKARSDTCPQGLPRFPGRGWQRIPQIKVKLLGVGVGRDCSGKKRLAGMGPDCTHLLGWILREPRQKAL